METVLGIVALLGLLLGGVALAVQRSGGRGKPTKILHNVRLTTYWVTHLDSGSIPLSDRNGIVLGFISEKSMKRLMMEGTGQLPDGRRVNYDNGKVWRLVPPGMWGYGVGSRALRPGESIAVDPAVIPLDSIVFLVDLGRWVKAVDTGDLIKGNHIDLFNGDEKAPVVWNLPDYVKTVEVYANK